MLYAGDERQHNNPDLAYVDSAFVRGGGRVTDNLNTLLTDFVNKLDQLKENVTTVYVISEDLAYRLVSKAQIGSLQNGWKPSTAKVDISGKANINGGNVFSGVQEFKDNVTVDGMLSVQDLAPVQFGIKDTNLVITTGTFALNCNTSQTVVNAPGVVTFDSFSGNFGNQLVLLMNKGSNNVIIKNTASIVMPGGADYTVLPGYSVILNVHGNPVTMRLMGGGSLTNAQVKSAYESNPNTNAFTDALLSKLNGIAAGATANDTDANLKNRANHTGTQAASTISDLAAAIASYITSTNKQLSTNDYTTTDKNKLAGIAAGATANDTDANLKSRANHTGTQAASTISDFATAAQNALAASLANKLNTGANAGLSGAGTAVALYLPDGTLLRDTNIYYDTANRQLYVGSGASPGGLSIASNTFLLQVQANITSGNAAIVFNDNQAKALVLKSTDGKEYLALRSTDGDEAVIFLQKFVFDMGVFAPVGSLQGQVSTSTANTKTYFTDSLGAVIKIPFGVDNVAIRFSGSFMAKNNAGTIGNILMGGTFRSYIKRINGVVSVVSTTTAIESDLSSYTPAVGAESLDNTTIQFFCQCTSATGFDWKLLKVEYTPF